MSFVNEPPQVASLRAFVERREHADDDTFCCGREFAEALLAVFDDLRDTLLAEVARRSQ